METIIAKKLSIGQFEDVDKLSLASSFGVVGFLWLSFKLKSYKGWSMQFGSGGKARFAGPDRVFRLSYLAELVSK